MRNKGRFYKYCIIFGLLLFLIEIVNKTYAQSTTIYPTEITPIDTSRIVFKKQTENFILGQEFPAIIIENIYYHKQAKRYMVFGFIDDVNYNDNVNYKVRIEILRGDKIIFTTFSSRNGVFAFSIGKEEIARFIGELYIDMEIR